MSRWPCKDYLKGTCTNSFCEKWHPTQCLFYKAKSGCRFGKSAPMQIVRLMNNFVERSKENDGKSAVALLKNTPRLGCVFQDMEPPKSWSILRKSSNVLKPIRCVRFTKAVVRHADIREQNPSLGIICPGDPHQRNSQCSKIWRSVSRRDGMARAMCPWSSVEAGQKCPKMKGETWNNILLTFGELVSICAIMQHHTFCRDTEETEMAPSPANCWSPGLVRTRSKAGRPAKMWEEDLNEFVKDEETQTTRSNIFLKKNTWLFASTRSTNGKRRKRIREACYRGLKNPTLHNTTTTITYTSLHHDNI